MGKPRVRVLRDITEAIALADDALKIAEVMLGQDEKQPPEAAATPIGLIRSARHRLMVTEKALAKQIYDEHWKKDVIL